MEQRRKPVLNEGAQHFLDKVLLNSRYSEEVKALVRSDVEHGLTEEQIAGYYKNDWQIEKMKIYSQCLRNGYEKEVIDVFTQDGISWEILKVGLEFYERRVPIDTVEELMYEMESPMEMRKSLEHYLNSLETAKENIEVAPDYVQKRFEQLEESIKGLLVAQTRYDELSQKLEELKTEKLDRELEARLMQENNQLNGQIIEQQEKLNKGEQKILELDNLLKQKDEEVKALKKQIADLTEENQSKDEQMADMAGKVEKMKSEAEMIAKAQQDIAAPKMDEVNKFTHSVEDGYTTQQTIKGGVPVYYQVPVMDNGRLVERVQVERTERKTGGMAAILGKICFKKKSRQDIVRLVSSGDLNAEQLEQIKVGMEKGLTESQLEQLINNNLSPERMAKVIAIAELDNKMND